ncbi:Hypothetical predicted protein [Scomber scombrus]|uniref:Uncharacterized protein n=1 Tax=Scomber scombrus TaxID=13677 RepID=A0AAV1QC77_SCOSC
MSGKPGTRATHSSKIAASDNHSGKAAEARANTSPNMQLTREDLKGMLDNMKDEILSELRCTVTTLQSTVSSHVVKIQEVEEGLNDVDGKVAVLERSYADLNA